MTISESHETVTGPARACCAGEGSDSDRGWMSACRSSMRHMAARIAAFLFVVALAATGLWVAHSYCAARSFERVTGHPVSTWDAMFLELRVQESPK